MIIWKPIMAKMVSFSEVKNGNVTLLDLMKMNALIDMKNDILKDDINKHGKEADSE